MSNRRNHKWMNRTVLAAATSLAMLGTAQADGGARIAAGAGSALAHANAGASLTAEQRVREELLAVMTELIESGAFGTPPPQQIALDVDTPAQRVSNLGVLIDSAHDSSDGLRVLAVTPGGGGERLGLRAGDELVALNGTSLAGGGAAATLRQAVDALPNGAPLKFDVRRDGHAQTLSGTQSSLYLPAMHLTVGSGVAVASNAGASTADVAGAAPATEQGCGRISDFDVAPRQQQLHGAKIISIDGVTPGPTGVTSYRVKAGKHTLKVAERIGYRYLSFNEHQRVAGLEIYKTLVVDVPANTTTLIAAHLNDEKRGQWQNGAYWDPVAWKQTAETCR